MRVLARDHDEVDDGWLCDKGRFAYQHVHTDERLVQPLVREGTSLQPASWEKALSTAARALEKAGARPPRWPAARPPTRRRSSRQAAARRARLGPPVGPAGGRAAARRRARARRPGAAGDGLRPRVRPRGAAVDADPIDDAPVWDLRIRKGVRRNGVRVGVASARPTALDTHAELTLRHAPGTGEALLVALDAALSGDRGNLGGAASTAGSSAGAVQDLADFLKGAEDLVIVYGERLLSGPGGARRRARCSTWSRAWASRAATAAACSRRRPPPTRAACARPDSPRPRPGL